MDYRDIQRILKGGPGSGEQPGHAFRGNQWTNGGGGKGGGGKKFKNFVPLSTKDIAEVESQLTHNSRSGGQHRGLSVVKLKDGSKAVVKVCPDEKQAVAEVMQAKVAEVLDVPIRDAEFVPGSKTEVVMPFVEGTSQSDLIMNGDSTGRDIPPAINFLDDLTGNWDRNAGNLMNVPGGKVVGIDGSSSFGAASRGGHDYYSVPDFTELGSPSQRQVMSWTNQLQALAPQFDSAGIAGEHTLMMDNWKAGATNYMYSKGWLHAA